MRTRRNVGRWRTAAAAAVLVPGAVAAATASTTAGATTTSGPGTPQLIPGERLLPGQSLVSSNHAYELVMDRLGDLTLNSLGTSVRRLWQANTRSAGAFAALNAAGDLAIYRGSTVVWDAGAHGGTTLTMQTDGNLVLASTHALWASGTAQAPPPPSTTTTTVPPTTTTTIVPPTATSTTTTPPTTTPPTTTPPPPPKQVTSGASLTANTELTEGHSLTADAGRFVLADQTDGNIVLYDGARVLWATGTFHPGEVLEMTSGGTLEVVFGSTVEWSSRTAISGSYAVVQADGNFVIYAGSAAVWQTSTVQPASGTGVYGGFGSSSLVSSAIQGSWPIIGDAGALGIPASPYTRELSSTPDALVAKTLSSSGSRDTWLSFWTVSGPATGDTWGNAGTVAGATAAHYLDTLSVKPKFVILDPEGYNGAPTTPATWSQFLNGWANGIRSVDANLQPAFYSNQSQYQAGSLSSIGLPAFIAVSPVILSSGSANKPYVSGTNISGFISYYAGCPAKPYETASNGWGKPYNTIQFSDSGVDCAA